MQYIPTNVKINLEWSVKKGVGNEAEDFSRSTVSLFLFSDENRWAIPCEADYTGVVRAEIPETMPEGVYNLDLLWIKNGGSIQGTRCLQRTRKTHVFAIDSAALPVQTRALPDLPTNPPIPMPGQPVTLRMSTVAAPYGYDGLSAYEAAILYGMQIEVSEKEWAETLYNYEASEASRVEAENIRKDNEVERIANEDTRMGNEEEREANEEARKTEEAERLQSETARNLAESTRYAQETLRETAERNRAQADQVRETNEVTREDNESKRIEQEETRRENEATRQKQEGTKDSKDQESRWGIFNNAEGLRQTNETTRISEETTRQSNEATRKANETAREANETVREANETIRQDGYYAFGHRMAQVEKEQEEFEQAIRKQVENYKPIVINGNVSNAADEEDLTSDENNLLKLKDRNSLDGMGYVILRKNKSFQEQVKHPNTVYEVRYDFDLGGQEVNIPENCVLKFEGGSLRNGTIACHKTIINKKDIGNAIITGEYSLPGLPILQYPDYKEGIFEISKDIIVEGGGDVKLDFTGYKFNVLSKEDNQTYVYQLTNFDSLAVFNVSIKGALKEDNSNSSQGYLSPIDLFNIGKVTVRDWVIEDVPTCALEVSRICKASIENVTISHCSVGIAVGKKITSKVYENTPTHVSIINCHVDCMKDFGTLASNTGKGGIGIYVNTLDNVLIENCTIINTNDTASKTDACNNVTYKNCNVRNFGKDGIKIQSVGTTPVRHSIISQCSAESKFDGRWDGSANFIITGSLDATVESCYSNCTDEERRLYAEKGWKDIIIGTSGAGALCNVNVNNNYCVCNGVHVFVGLSSCSKVCNNYLNVPAGVNLSGKNVLFENNILLEGYVRCAAVRLMMRYNDITTEASPIIMGEESDTSDTVGYTKRLYITHNQINTTQTFISGVGNYLEKLKIYVYNNNFTAGSTQINFSSSLQIQGFYAHKNQGTLHFKHSKWVENFIYNTDESVWLNSLSYVPKGVVYYTAEGKYQVITTGSTSTGISLTNQGIYVGSTNERQKITKGEKGCICFDTTLSKPIWWTGEKWVDATGATV